jgi:hypothetical protein
MRPIRALLCTWWKRRSGTNWITARNGSRPEMHCGRRCIAAGDALRPEMDRGRRWIAAGNGLRPDMVTRDGSCPEVDCGLIWIVTGYGLLTEVDDRRWMTGDGSQQMKHGRRMTINLLPFYEDIQAIRSYTILEITTLNSNYEVSMEHRYACIQCTGGMAPPSTIPSTIQSTTQCTTQSR